MKKKLHLTSSFFLLASSFSLFAAGGVWLPVHSYEKSTSPIHVKVHSYTNLSRKLEWTFLASYTGHRSVCWLPGASTNMAFMAWVGGDSYAPGDPFGFTPAASSNNTQAIALTRTTAITPRIKLWEAESSDRIARFGIGPVADNDTVDALKAYHAVTHPTGQPGSGSFNNINTTLPTSQDVRVRVLCVSVDDHDATDIINEDRIILDRTFSRDVRDYIHEGDFLGDGNFDIDWATFEDDIVSLRPYFSNFEITNVAYAVVIGEGNASRVWGSNGREVLVHPVLITRRFEVTHTPPTAVGYDSATGMFRWRIAGEDSWAAQYGTTYTAFRLQAYGSTTNDVVCDSGYRHMPPAWGDGTFRWRAPASWTNALQSATSWRVFTYNAKFKTDNVGSAATQFTP